MLLLKSKNAIEQLQVELDACRRSEEDLQARPMLPGVRRGRAVALSFDF